MQKLAIIGGGGHAAVILDLIQAINEIQPTYEVVGIFDDRPEPVLYNQIRIGMVADIHLYEHHFQWIVAIGNNTVRQQIAQAHPELIYATLIHPSVIVGSQTAIGAGTVVMAGSIIQANATIGQHSIINTGAIVDHDGQVGDYTHIAQRTTLTGGVQIGDNCYIGAGSVIAPWQQVTANTVLPIGSHIG